MKQFFVVQDAITNEFYAHNKGAGGWVTELSEAMRLGTHAQAMQIANGVIAAGQTLQVVALLSK